MFRKLFLKSKVDSAPQSEDKINKCHISYEAEGPYYLSPMEPDYYENPVIRIYTKQEKMVCGEAKKFFDAICHRPLTISNLKATGEDGTIIAYEPKKYYSTREASIFARKADAFAKCNKTKSDGSKELDKTCFAFESNNEVNSSEVPDTNCVINPFARPKSQYHVISDELYSTSCHLTNLNEGADHPRPSLNNFTIDITTTYKPSLFEKCTKTQRVFYSKKISLINGDAEKVLEEAKKRFT